MRAFYPDTLPPNPQGGYSNSFYNTNHNFVDTYLDQYGPFRNRIRDQILQTINLIEIPEKKFECLDPDEVDVDVDTLAATNISSTSAKLNGRVVSGKNIYVDFILQASYQSSTMSCYDKKLGTSGNWMTGDQFYSFVSLQPDTIYYYRACGREGDRISSGTIFSFKTDPVPVQECGSDFTTQGGTEGLSVEYDMGSTSGIVHVTFNTFEIPDKLEIWQNGNIIYSTSYISGKLDVDICHKADKGPTWVIKVYGNSNQNTAWNISISCPGPSNSGVFNMCF